MTTEIKGAQPAHYLFYKQDMLHTVEGAVIEEGRVCIFLNGCELATFMCTPHHLDELAIGFLRSEGLIHRLADIKVLTVSASQSCVDVWLDDVTVKPPARRIITSGCGGGVTFDDLRTCDIHLNTHVTLSAGQINLVMKKLNQAASLYEAVQGVHTSALSDGQELLLVTEDVGRHNTIDRLWGRALQQGLATEGRILLSTGRISSEMLGKAVKMGVPIVISRTSPTSHSVELARAANVTLIGYARANSFRIYAVPERVQVGVPIETPTLAADGRDALSLPWVDEKIASS